MTRPSTFPSEQAVLDIWNRARSELAPRFEEELRDLERQASEACHGDGSERPPRSWLLNVIREHLVRACDQCSREAVEEDQVAESIHLRSFLEGEVEHLIEKLLVPRGRVVAGAVMADRSRFQYLLDSIEKPGEWRTVLGPYALSVCFPRVSCEDEFVRRCVEEWSEVPVELPPSTANASELIFVAEHPSGRIKGVDASLVQSGGMTRLILHDAVAVLDPGDGAQQRVEAGLRCRLTIAGVRQSA